MAATTQKPTGDEQFGRRVYKARLAAGLSRLQLGTLLGVTQQTVHHWEAGNRAPSLRHVRPLAEALKVSVGQLLHDRPRKSS